MTDATPVRIGVDVGGTFTDVVVVHEGRATVEKVPSTPSDPAAGVLDGLDAVLAASAAPGSGDDDRPIPGQERPDDDEKRDEDAAVAAEASGPGVTPDDIEFFGHGTTVATNAVLERSFADVHLLTTAGFRDALEIGRQDRPELYDFDAEKPPTIVPRDRRHGVGGRLDERGREVEPLDEARVRELAAELDAAGADAVAVSYLFPFENDGHERRTRELLAASDLDAAVSLSSSVLPEIREYERTAATALNAALKPRMAGYVGRLVDGVAARGIDADVEIMQSGGGLVAAETAQERPVNTLLSGPAAGVQGAAFVAERHGVDDLITMDTGGTSCDVSLVTDGDPPVTTEATVGDYPVPVPTVDVHTVGAGGGSIAWVDDGGALRVGPRSAGADPGPVCYGRGGEQPTITDAHHLLGRIDPGGFVDEPADRETVAGAVERAVADPLGTDIEAAAAGILRVAAANTERALRVVSVERGHDPREFALVAYGGAGPLHAAKLAAALDVPRVIVPRAAGVLSALGLLVGDVAYDTAVSRVRRLSAVDPDDLAATYADFEREGRQRLRSEGFDGDAVVLERRADLRYAGQSFELSVPVPGGLDGDALATVADRFHERHRERYGHASPDEPVELVTLRLRARGIVDPPSLSATAEGRADDPSGAVAETRSVAFGGRRRDTPAYDRERLPLGATVDGPAIVEGGATTAVVRPADRLRVADDAALLVDVGVNDDA